MKNMKKETILFLVMVLVVSCLEIFISFDRIVGYGIIFACVKYLNE